MKQKHSFGAWLRDMRLAADLTQEGLAEAVGCAAETMRSFENGRRRPSRAMAARLADTLRVSPAEREQFISSARDVQAVVEAPASPPDSALVEPPALAALLPLLATKLYLLRPRAELVARPRLLARLNAARPLTLIAAPAGFGKTTLLIDWLQQNGERRTMSDEAPEAPAHRSSFSVHRFKVAWLSLDAGDSDPSLFLRYLIAALQTIEPRVGATVLGLLGGAQSPPLDALLPLLVRDLILLPEGSVLVLDDYHLIDAPVVHRALTFLVEHLPPQLQLIIASRVDPPLPLGRLRARGQLTELRAPELRFTLEEAAAFFQRVMDVPIRDEDVAALEARTEGWVAGLQLAALAMQQRDDTAAFVRAFAGSNRFVVDYLAEEVLERLPSHLHTFVLQTAVLDRLCGPLCDAVLGVGSWEIGGRDDASPNSQPPFPNSQAYSQLILDQLERANVFLIPLDDERRWYRYHHLFGEVVRARLLQGAPPERIVELHRRASAWYERTGLESEAIQHALAAADWERAARLLIHAFPNVVVGRGQFHTGLRWLQALPERTLREHPTLGVYYAGILVNINQLDAAEAQLREIARALAAGFPAGRTPEQARAIQGQAAAVSGALCRMRGDLVGSVAHFQEALSLLPEPETTPLKLRPLAMLNAAHAFLVTGDVTPAVETETMAVLASLRATGNLFALFGLISVARLQVCQGRLRQAAATYAEVRALAAGSDDLQAMDATYYVGLGDIHREWNDLATAEELLGAGLRLLQGGAAVYADVLTQGAIAMAKLQQARGDAAGALRTVGTFLEMAFQHKIVPYLIDRVLAVQAILLLMQGDLARAVDWADACTLDLAGELSYLREDEYLALARVRIAQAGANLAAPGLGSALKLLDRLLASAEAAMRVNSVIAILALRALVLRARGERAVALTDLGRALALAAPEGYVRVFVDEGPPMAALLREAQAAGLAPGYVAALLAAFPPKDKETRGQGDDGASSSSNTISLSPGLLVARSLVEPLTVREREVLHLLAEGRSNQAIADTLVVTVGTVKRHLNSIFAKLGAQTRLEAVVRARGGGLLQD